MELPGKRPAQVNEYLRRFREASGTKMPALRKEGNTRTDRRELVKEYAWAVPTSEAIQAIADLGPIIEIGAETGYWAMLLRDAGADVLAFDLYPPDSGKNKFGHNKAWTEVLEGSFEKVTDHPGRTVFLCWPSYSEEWATNCAHRTHAARLVYIGEREGCTANDEFHWITDGTTPYEFDDQYIEDDEERKDMATKLWGPQLFEEERWIEIPQWWGLHDGLTIFKRKES